MFVDCKEEKVFIKGRNVFLRSIEKLFGWGLGIVYYIYKEVISRMLKIFGINWKVFFKFSIFMK